MRLYYSTWKLVCLTTAHMMQHMYQILKENVEERKAIILTARFKLILNKHRCYVN